MIAIRNSGRALVEIFTFEINQTISEDPEIFLKF